MYLFAIIVIALFAMFGVIIGVQNAAPVEVHILGKVFNPSLIVVMIMAFAGGAILAFILAIIDEIKLRARLGRQQKEIENLQKELGTFKTMPTDEERE
ncbi:LapA family protein [candidate division WOR-3 bacterium]|nr:LapA family protein [candidate division WOR-3 bacterium]